MGILSVAETSQPHCAVQDDQRPDGSGPGHKHVHAAVDAVRVNWQNPILWPTILRAALSVGHGMSPLEITTQVKHIDPINFASITPQVISRWIDRTGSKPMWKASTLTRAIRGNLPSNMTTCYNILTPYPNIVESIVDLLHKLCEAGIALDLSHCCLSLEIPFQ